MRCAGAAASLLVVPVAALLWAQNGLVPSEAPPPPGANVASTDEETFSWPWPERVTPVPVVTLRTPHAPSANDLLKKHAGGPVVFRGSVVDTWPARHQWTWEFLGAGAMGATQVHGVYSSHSNHFGPFFDHSRPLAKLSTVRPRNAYRRDSTLTVHTLVDVALGRTSVSTALQDECSSDGDNGACDGTAAFVYYSGALDSLGADAVRAVSPLDELLSLNPSKSSVNVWIGQGGVVAPCHYDGYHNLYAHLRGRKRFVMLQPSAWEATAPFPFLHPSHAQCQVNLTEPATAALQFPALSNATIHVVDLEAGDLLYMPPLTFHSVYALAGGSVSVNVWTSPQEEATAEQLFGLPMPGGLPLKAADRVRVTASQEADLLAGIVVAAAGAAASPTCSNRHRDGSASSGPWQCAKQGLAFVRRVWVVRYKALLDDGELPSTVNMVASEPRLAGVLGMCGGDKSDVRGVTLLRRALRVSGADGDVAGYVRAVGSAAASLPDDTRELWSGNFVEYVASAVAGPRFTGAYLAALVARCGAA